MKRYVLKFGGSSVETIEKMRMVAERIIARYDKDTELVVVVSAMGKTTSNLFSKAREITLSPNKRDLDLLLSTGEVVAISYLSIILNDMGYPAISLTGRAANIYTKGEFQNSKIVDIDVSNILKHLEEGKIVVVAGYQGVNVDGDITTLGREGSDTTAVTLAHYLNCPCEIYSDVAGVYEVDPRILSNSNKHDELSYNDLLLLSNFGAKVIATSAIDYALSKKVPLLIASTFDEESKGTVVTKDINKDLDFVGIVCEKNVRILNILDGVSTDLINKFINQGIKVDIINNNLVSLSSDEVITLEEAINDFLDEDEYTEDFIDENIVKVSVIGRVLEAGEFRNYLIGELENDLINIFLTKHNVNRLSIFISIEDTLLSIKKLYKIIKGRVENEQT